MWRSFFCALVAAFVLRSINPFGNEHLVMFYVGNSRPWILFELVPFLIIGMGGGIIGAIFIKFNIKWCQRRKSSNLGRHPIFEVITITGMHFSQTLVRKLTTLFFPCFVLFPQL